MNSFIRSSAVIAVAILPTSLAAQDATTATAEMQLADGMSAGIVEMTETPNGVLFEIALSEMPLGEHGFHLHEAGACTPDFEAAGGHFAPEGNEHGFMNTNGPHAGDMPNIVVMADGSATAQMLNARVSLTGDAALMDADGSAIIVHENPDSYRADPGAGGRIACGEIELD